MLSKNRPIIDFVYPEKRASALRKLTKWYTVFTKWSPFDYQQRLLFDLFTKDRIVAVLCRQTGKSDTIAHYVALQSLLKTNINILIFAPTDRQTGELFSKIYNVGMNIPLFKAITKRATQREIELKNGVRIVAQTVGDKGEGIRGYTGHIIILEEAGSIKDSIVQEVILPMGATAKFRTGKEVKFIKIGTPRGMNHFYESYQNSMYEVHQYDYRYAVRAGLHSNEFYDQRRKDTQDMEFRTEYEAEFIADQDAYFSYEMIDYCTGEPEIEEKAAEGYEYFLGVDPSRQGNDDCVFIVVKKGIGKENNRVVKILEYNKILINQILGQIVRLDNLFHFKKIYVDETGLGAGVSDFGAERFGELNITDDRLKKLIGITFTNKNKKDLYSNLHILMGTRGGGGIRFPRNRKLIAQLRDFRYEIVDSTGDIKLHHSEYGKDDFCDALVLGVAGINIQSTGDDIFVMDMSPQGIDYAEILDI